MRVPSEVAAAVSRTQAMLAARDDWDPDVARWTTDVTRGYLRFLLSFVDQKKEGSPDHKFQVEMVTMWLDILAGMSEEQWWAEACAAGWEEEMAWLPDRGRVV